MSARDPIADIEVDFFGGGLFRCYGLRAATLVFLIVD
jgi:hypothetical protein